MRSSLAGSYTAEMYLVSEESIIAKASIAPEERLPVSGDQRL